MKGSARSGLVFAAKYISLILLALVIIVTLVYIVAWIRFDEPGTISFISLLEVALPRLMPFYFLTILAFAAGYCPEGSKDRMYIRMMMSSFMIFCIFFVSTSVTYGIEEMVINEGIGSYFRDLELTIDITHISMILSALPIMSIVDAILEYRHNRDSLFVDEEST